MPSYASFYNNLRHYQIDKSLLGYEQFGIYGISNEFDITLSNY